MGISDNDGIVIFGASFDSIWSSTSADTLCKYSKAVSRRTTGPRNLAILLIAKAMKFIWNN